jgi:hypothetical protein
MPFGTDEGPACNSNLRLEGMEAQAMLTRHHRAILVTIGAILAVIAIAIAMEPGLAHSVF